MRKDLWACRAWIYEFIIDIEGCFQKERLWACGFRWCTVLVKWNSCTYECKKSYKLIPLCSTVSVEFSCVVIACYVCVQCIKLFTAIILSWMCCSMICYLTYSLGMNDEWKYLWMKNIWELWLWLVNIYVNIWYVNDHYV